MSCVQMFAGMAFFLVVVTVVPEPELGGDDEEDETEGVSAPVIAMHMLVADHGACAVIVRTCRARRRRSVVG